MFTTGSIYVKFRALFLLLGLCFASQLSAAIPVVSGVNPPYGPTSGNTSVTISGTGFAGTASVEFGGMFATIMSSSSTSIVVTTPAHVAGTVDVIVTASGGTSIPNPNDQFTYDTTPSVTGVTPAFGSVTGGAMVMITGTGLGSATAVHFGSSAASFTVNSDTSITATSPAHAAGTVDVTVTNPEGTSPTNPPNDQFTFDTTPSVTGVTPAFGSVTGGAMVMITGTGFDSATFVHFGSSAVSFMINSDTSITATSPAHAAGTVDVTVTNPEGTSPTNPPNDQFTFDTTPSVTGVTPAFGSVTGGAMVMITGTGFDSATFVHFGSSAASFTVNSDMSITATSPAHAAGTVDVTVTNPEGTSPTNPPNDQFTFDTTPVVNSVSPSSGPVDGGTIVTITGTSFDGVYAVDFGGTSASFTVNSDMSITATSPPNTAGTVDVTVTNPEGTSPTNPPNDQFTYSILSPSSFVGVIRKAQFLNVTTYSLRATWQASPSSDVVLYRIFEGTVLVDEVSANSSLVFITQLDSKSAAKTYQIAAVDMTGTQSALVPITIINP